MMLDTILLERFVRPLHPQEVMKYIPCKTSMNRVLLLVSFRLCEPSLKIGLFPEEKRPWGRLIDGRVPSASSLEGEHAGRGRSSW